jgi:predicted NUDIX family NTP pyrophosphohydrolase
VKKTSAGILMYRGAQANSPLEILLVHPGGPFWAKKDLGAWSIPKGEIDEEEPLEAARREFFEETGTTLAGDLLPLAPQKLKNGKNVYAWAVEGDLDPAGVASNTFELEWPPHSGKLQSFPEIDKAAWFSVQVAIQKINPGLAGFIYELINKLGVNI